MVGPKRADMETRGEVEEADGAVGESAGQVVQRQSEAAAHEAVGFVHVGLVELEDRVERSAVTEVAGRSVPVDVFISPRVQQPEAPTPYPSGQTMPQKLRARHRAPRGAHLQPTKKQDPQIKYYFPKPSESQSATQAVSQSWRSTMTRGKKGKR